MYPVEISRKFVPIVVSAPTDVSRDSIAYSSGKYVAVHNSCEPHPLPDRDRPPRPVYVSHQIISKKICTRHIIGHST